ncbi:MAG: DUF2145 domain-containing protein [Pseudomonadota bacterium]
MKKRLIPFLWLLLACVLCLFLDQSAFAGQACENKPLSVDEIVKSMDLAQHSVQALDDSGAQVALIARAGQDLSKYGLRYSHMALAWRDHPQGRWLVVHELNECGTAQSALFNEGMGNFFLTDLYAYEAKIVIPGAATQERLARLLASSTPRRLHESKYNMLAYAYSTHYQNSNQWVLESYAAASAPAGQVETRQEAQAWLKNAPFRPITVELSAATRLGARMFRANVAFDDHPFDRRMAGQIDTVSVDAVVRFIRQQERDAREMTVRLR